MKKTLVIFLAIITAFTFIGCKSTNQAGKKTIKAKVVQNYFFANILQAENEEFIVKSEKIFNKYFSPATTMGMKGKPTKIDFEKQAAICVVIPMTDILISLDFVELTQNEDKSLTFSYRMTWGDVQSYVMQPILIVAVDKKYLTNGVKFNRILVK